MRKVLKSMCFILLCLGLSVSIYGCGSSKDGDNGPGSTEAPPDNITNDDPSGDGDIAEDLAPDEYEERLGHKSFDVEDEDVLNPERGLRKWTDILEDNYSKLREKGYTLAYARIFLKDYINNHLDATFLRDLSAKFADVRSAGVKLILRVAYSDSEDAITDAPLDMILSHIAELRPLLVQNADVIFAMQAGFIGRWGEWHSSTNGLDDDQEAKDAIVNTLLNALPRSRMIMLRTPEYKADFLGTDLPLSESGAFTGEDAARIGHHNDCFLASDTDKGTYPKDEIDYWKDYISSEGEFVPVGGSACKLNPPRSDCTTALVELKKLHWSYISGSSGTGVVQAWDEEGCLPEIKKRLGYRYVLGDLWWTEEIAPGGTLHIKISLTNEGYAPVINERDVYLVLSGSTKSFIAELNTDPRKWRSGETIEIEDHIGVPFGIAPGEYDLSLSLPDSSGSLKNDPRYSIRMANKGVWEPETGLNRLVGIKIDPAAPTGTLVKPRVYFHMN